MDRSPFLRIINEAAEGERLMVRIIQCSILLVLCGVWIACGGGGDTTGETDNDVASVKETIYGTPDSTRDAYRSDHDPDAFYTRENVNFTGSYLKVEMDDLTPDQFNRVIHRLKTEKSTCGSGNTIDECLVNRPGCWVAVELLKQVVREEKLKG
jgi:hypothetical protein